MNMKIKCKVCNTIYDNKEKYCPYCFNRTFRNHDCYNLNSEVVYSKDKYRQPDRKLYEGKAIQNQRNRANSFNYQQRSKSKYIKNNKINSNAALTTALLIVFGMIFFSLFIMVFMNLIFFF